MATGGPVTSAPAPQGGEAEQSFAEAHQALLADGSLQLRFDDAPEPPQPPDMQWLRDLAAFLEMISPFLFWVFWGGLALAVAFLLFVIIREVIRHMPAFRQRQKAVAEEPVIEFRPTKERARALLEEADRLAREGRYSEAARVLLHRSIEDIQNLFPIQIGPAMTSREIGRVERLSPRARDPFVRIAQAVELSLFGGRDLNAEQYQECRQIYETFAFEGKR